MGEWAIDWFIDWLIKWMIEWVYFCNQMILLVN